jgi:CubicO group peptidase (beta-lactamase class C family)
MKADNVPGLQVCYIEKDKLLGCYAFGWAQVNTQKMTDESVFLWASVSKTVTAAAHMKAQELGAVDIDADINKWLHTSIINPNGGTVTLRSLATHVGGVTDDVNVNGNALMDTFRVIGYHNPVISLEDAVNAYFKNDAAFASAVGERNAYSNMGSALGGYVLQAAVKSDLNDFIAEQIFIPLSMDSSTFYISEVPQVKHANHYGGNFEKWTRSEFYSFSDYPNGGLRSSARDIVRFLATIANGGICSGIRIFKADTVSHMLALQPQQKGAEDFPQLYGFFKENDSLGAWIGHNGGEENIASEMWFRPLDGVGYAAFTNHENFTSSLKLLLKKHAIALKGTGVIDVCGS